MSSRLLLMAQSGNGAMSALSRREFIGSALGGKWVELLKEIAPRTVRVALLFNPATAPVRKHKPSTDSRPRCQTVRA
jgi:predicted esterase YcpF (UPF0227 family)